MKRYSFRNFTKLIIIVVAAALMFTSCNNENDEKVIGDSTLSLAGTWWQSDWIYDIPIIDIDYVDIEKSMTKLYFLDDHRYIKVFAYKSIDSFIGESSGKGEFGGTYTIVGSRVKLSPTNDNAIDETFILKNGVLVAEGSENYILEKKGIMTSADKNWAETEYYAFLPDSERLNFNVGIAVANMVTPYYSPNEHCYIAYPVISFNITADQHPYEKKMSHVEATFYIQNGTFDGKYKTSLKVSAFIDPGKDVSVSLSQFIRYKGTATITAKLQIYDGVSRKYITLVEKTYSVDATTGIEASSQEIVPGDQGGSGNEGSDMDTDGMSKLVGTWKCTKSYEYELITFRQDGTGTWEEYYDGVLNESSEIKWSYNNATSILTTIWLDNKGQVHEKEESRLVWINEKMFKFAESDYFIWEKQD